VNVAMDEGDQEISLEEENEETEAVKVEVIEDDFGDFTVTKHKDMKLITIRGKNLEFLNARRNLLKVMRTASFNKGQNEVNNTKFKVTNFKALMYSNECEVEVCEKSDKGKCKLTLYKDNKKKEGKKDQTIMVTKLAKHDSKFVKVVVENIIQYLLEGFLTKSLSDSVVVEKDVKEEKQEVHKCDICDNKFVSNAGLKTHKTRIHGKKDRREGEAFFL